MNGNFESKGESLANAMASSVMPKIDAITAGWLEELSYQGEWELLLGGAVNYARLPEVNLPIFPEVAEYYSVLDDGAVLAAKQYFADLSATR